MNLSRVRVRAGYTAGALALFFAEPTELSLVRGGALAILGELIRIWASGHIEKTHKLATGGPYAHTRNPLYVGSVLMALGLLVAVRHPIAIAAGFAYLVVFYPFIIREEAKFLRGKFPEAYHDWARHVPLFFPRLTPGGPRQSKYQLGRLLANHEWRSVLGLALLAAFLIWRLP
ncbi:MAG: isoprenylcysteine carboxylmethyltransferase family protein [Vicinamibacteria bacterium]|nr:isoprenylcysteine carboxylmethyltransferase family protein [Vicinamibacteria bacterium]MBP9947179.1 isoprenylcysteine carboxylmethyltransferase family protein [Vicinamibacteria bacterium]